MNIEIMTLNMNPDGMECKICVTEDRRFLESVETFDYETATNMIQHDELKEFCKLMNTSPTSKIHKHYAVKETGIPTTIVNEKVALQKTILLQPKLPTPTNIDAQDEEIHSSVNSLNVIHSRCKRGISPGALLWEYVEEVVFLDENKEEVISDNTITQKPPSTENPRETPTIQKAKEKVHKTQTLSKNDTVRDRETCSSTKDVNQKEHMSTLPPITSRRSLINKEELKCKTRPLQSHLQSHFIDALNKCSLCNTSHTRRCGLVRHVQTKHNVKSICVRKTENGQINSEEKISKSFMVKSGSSEPIYIDARKAQVTHDEWTGTTKGNSKPHTSQGVLLEENTEEVVSDNASTQKLTLRESSCETSMMNKANETKEPNVKLESNNCTIRGNATCSNDKNINLKEDLSINEDEHRCKKTFSETNALKAHVEGHLNVPRYKCSFCEASYVYSYGLKRHVKSKHNLASICTRKSITLGTHQSKKEGMVNTKQVNMHTENKDTICALEGDLSITGIRFMAADTKSNNINEEQAGKMDFDTRNETSDVGAVDTRQENITAKNSSNGINYTEINVSGKLKEVLKLEYNDMNIDSVTYDMTSEECPICRKTDFKPLARLREHIQCHTNIARYKCGVCSKIFKKERHVVRHTKIHEYLRYGDSGNKKNSTSSPEDRDVMDKPDGDGGHMLYNSQVYKFFQCNICQEKLSDIDELRIHIATHEFGSAETVECKTCYKPFLTTYALQHHSKKAHNKGIFECFHCGEAFESSKDFANHCLENHSVKKAFKCDDCDKSYALLQRLREHRQCHSTNRSAQCICSECGKTCIDGVRLKSHMRMHSNVKPFQCDKCGNQFLTAGRLKSHYDVHTGERPFACETCGKQFRKKIHLNFHLSSHSVARPYKCESCGKDYKLKMHLDKHMSLHTGKMKHKCEMCGRKFVEKNKLDSHVRAHRGEKPFECKTCGKAFQDKFPFQKHMLTHNSVVKTSDT